MYVCVVVFVVVPVYAPVEQLIQLVCPLTGWYCPVGHGIQVPLALFEV